MSVLLGILGFLLLLTVVVVIHESGHYVLAKLSGVRVDEFAIGFGPRLLAKKLGETVYSVRALPLGGFVRMPGMLGLEGEADAGERNFYRASMPRRIATLVAGVLANFLLGAVCFTVVFAHTVPPRVAPGEAAAQGGLKDGDVITAIGGITIDTTSNESIAAGLHQATQLSRGADLTVVYRSADGSTRQTRVHPQLVLYGPGLPQDDDNTPIVITAVEGRAVGTGDPRELLGNGGAVTVSGFRLHDIASGTGGDAYGPATVRGVDNGDGGGAEPQAAWRIGYATGQPGEPLLTAARDGVLAIPEFVTSTAGAIGDLFVHPSTAAGQFSGPVGIAAETGSTVKEGWIAYIGEIGLVSLSLGFLNVLPIPFLDGGRLLFLVIEAVRHRRMDPRREAAVHAAGLALLILVVVLITIGDIHNLSSGSPR
jgi:regulator of sigma E protease